MMTAAGEYMFTDVYEPIYDYEPEKNLKRYQFLFSKRSNSTNGLVLSPAVKVQT